RRRSNAPPDPRQSAPKMADAARTTQDAPGHCARAIIGTMNDTGSDEEREHAISAFTRAGRESSRLAVMFRHALASRLGLTVTDMECVDFLTDTGSATAGQIAERTNLTTGAITSMIRRLEQAGYVTSHRDPADRRRVVVTLAPEKLDHGRQLY